ncbi:flagella synthesis protein FlgN [Vibrio maerlii]|uniref:flagella synthesis protein FlgN n=1 Tax=Vibrio maerlii TaxID=2231648 RepID=UPI000E3EC5D3|nr:flagellar export chaperone FlgN [Vibrio maerlii]
MAALKDLVDFQLSNALSLSQLLVEEKVAITQRVSADIESAAKKKLELITLLRQTDERIAKHDGVSQLTEDPELKDKVIQIQSVIHDCQQANTVNGEALQRAQLSYNKLNNLMQQSHGKIGMTYNAGGQTHTISTLGTTVKA